MMKRESPKDPTNSRDRLGLPAEQDILSCVESFLGPRCLVAAKHGRHENKMDFEEFMRRMASGESVDEDEPRVVTSPQLVRIHIKPKIKSTSSSGDAKEGGGSFCLEEVVTVETSIEVGSSDHQERVLAAHDNGRIAVVEKLQNHEDNAWHVRYLGVSNGGGDDKCPVVQLPEQAHSIYVIGTSVFLGFVSSVGWVDFSSSEPVYEELCRRNLGNGKAYDMFTQSGNLLVAVDDMMMPYYADAFIIGEDGVPKHKEGWTLPSLVNGRYTLAGTTDNNEILLAHSYCRRGGSGCGLLRKPIQAFSVQSGAVPFGPRMTPLCMWYEPRVDVEGEDRWSPQWRSLAVRKDAQGKDQDILLAVGKRGILVLPVDFKGDTTPSFVSSFDGRPVLAVRTFVDSAWALVGRKRHSEVVKVDDDGTKATALPAKFDTFL